jgi:hypothetical protein
LLNLQDHTETTKVVNNVIVGTMQSDNFKNTNGEIERSYKKEPITV